MNLTSDIFTSKNVIVKAVNKTTGNLEGITGATVSMYVGSQWVRNGTDNGNGSYTVSLAGLSSYQIANATISASKVMESGSAIDGTARDALFQYFGRNGDNEIIRYQYELHSETIDTSGNWRGVKLNSVPGGSLNLILKEPRLKVNLAVCYLANDAKSRAAEYKQAIQNCVSKTSETLAQATDGHVMLNKVIIFSTGNRLNFYDTSNKASMADLRIETRVKDDGQLWSNVKIHSNAIPNGYYFDNSYFFDDDYLEKFKNLKGGETFQNTNSFYRIQMSGTQFSWNYTIYDTQKYAETITHEVGHYLLGFFDEYLTGLNNGKDDVKWGDQGTERPTVNGKTVYFGLMDNQYEDTEMSKKDTDYAYLTGGETEGELTEQYFTLGKSCQDYLADRLSQGETELPQLALGNYSGVYTTSSTVDRKVTYPYAALSESDFIDIPATKTTATNAVTPYTLATPTHEELALVYAQGSAATTNLTVYPAQSGVFTLYHRRHGEEIPTEIPLTPSGANYTATVDIAQGDMRELILVKNIDGTYLSNEIYVDRSETGDTGYLYQSADNCVLAYVIPESSASYTFTSNSVALTNEEYRAVNQATYISSDNGTATAQGELYSVAAVDSDIDFTTLSWFVFQNGVWTPLTSDYSTEENMNIGVRCDFAGDGLYCLMAEEAVGGSLVAVTDLTGVPSNDKDGSVAISFNDSNASEDIAYYHIYYSDNAFTLSDDDGVALKIVYPSQDGYTLNLLQAGASTHVAVVAVGANGAKSPLSAVVPITGGEADIDADGIPDWYCDQYLLWGLEGENKDIAISDDDGDHISNLDEFNNDTDPTNPYDPMPKLNASSTTVIDAGSSFIYGLQPGMTQADFESSFVSVNGYARLDFNSSSGGFGTGTRVGFIHNATNVEMTAYQIVIFGDVNGDGNIDTTDAGSIVDYENFLIPWDPLVDSAYMTAADLNGDGNVDTTDAGLIVDVENFLLTVDQTTGLTVPL